VRAAVCRAFGTPLRVEDLELDPPEQGQARVRIVACAICHSDIAFVDGAWGGMLPAVYGHEAAGIVEEVAAGVSDISEGDRVVVSLLRSCGRCFFCERGQPHLCAGSFPGDREGRLRTRDGEVVHRAMHTAAFAEQVVVDQSQLARVPATMSLDVAALLGCGVATGFGAVVERADVAAGASVVVVGVGGVGLNCVQAAAHRGAETIVAVDLAETKRDAARVFGATHALDPAGADLASEVRDLTGGRGADYVFVTVGRGSVAELGLTCVRRGGTVVVVGMPPSGDVIRVVGVDLVNDDVRLLGTKMGSASLAKTVPMLVELYEDGRLKLDELISGRYPLERIDDAIADARSGDALRNVIAFDAE
jgi:S-(hydroxymethyl)glutathione dehydrogenase / alcohol dehydrogenase